jgi:hypothetical protein
LKKYLKLVFILFFCTNYIFAEENLIPEDAKLVNVEVQYDQPPIIVENEIGEDTIAVATIRGKILTDGYLKSGTVDCRLVGHAAPGRVFSCGFAQVESVEGYCIFKNSSEEGLVAKLSCSTAANGIEGASCQGRLDFLSGSGIFAGVSGNAKLNMSQVFSTDDSFLKFDGFWKLPALLLR